MFAVERRDRSDRCSPTRRFAPGLVMQAIAAVWSCAGLYRALRTHTPDELRLKRQFALVFLRWVVVLMATYTGVVFLFGRWASLVFVAVYAGASIVIDIAPDKFLRVMPGGAADANLPATPAVKPAEASQAQALTFHSGDPSRVHAESLAAATLPRPRRKARPRRARHDRPLSRLGLHGSRDQGACSRTCASRDPR